VVASSFVPATNLIQRRSPVNTNWTFVHDWNGDPRAFGAIPNDTINDTAAFQAACDYAFSIGAGANRPQPGLQLSPGNYIISGLTSKVSIISVHGGTTSYWNSDPVRFQSPVGATNDCLILDSEGAGRTITIEGICFNGQHGAGPRRGASLTSVTSRTSLSVDPSALPDFTNWAPKGGVPFYGWIGFWTAQNYYLGAAVLQTVNTNTGAITLAAGTDNYATRTGTNLLETGIGIKVGFGDVITVNDPQYGPFTGG
jgi:hypothetical protein